MPTGYDSNSNDSIHTVLDASVLENNLDSCYKLQLDAIEQVKQLHSSYKKDAKDRKKVLLYYKKRFEKLDTIQQSFMERHQLMVRISDDNKHDYFVKTVFMEFDDVVMDYTIELSTASDALRERLLLEAPSSQSHTNTNAQQQHGRISDFSLRLPKISLPEFSGQYVDWPEFYDSFNRLIHMNMQLANVEKFRHLKSALPQNFDTDILCLPLTEANYSIAWQRLIERYNNKRALFANYFNQLMSLSRMEKECATEIKKLKQVANSCFTGLTQLNLESNVLGQVIVHILASKLAKITHQQWETHLGISTEIPSFNKFMEFLNTRFRTLESWELFATNSNSNNNKSNTQSKQNSQQTKTFHTNHVQVQPSNAKSKKSPPSNNSKKQSQQPCSMCKDSSHSIRSCSQFLQQDCFARKDTVDRLKLCLNCFHHSHAISSCTSVYNCQTCGKRHHTLLHFPNNHRNNNASTEETDQKATLSTQLNHTQIIQSNNLHFDNIIRPIEVLLPTAIVYITIPDGSKKPLRALLDQGSTGALISKHAVSALKLKQYKINSNITLPAEQKSTGDNITALTITSSLDPNFEMSIFACVVKKPTENLPTKTIKGRSWSHLANLTLADPDFMNSRAIDILLGADVYTRAIQNEIIRGEENEPIAQKTVFGWIISGSVVKSNTQPTFNIKNNHLTININDIFQSFYESEGISNEDELSPEQNWCEKFFVETHKRQSNGKYLVKLPLKSRYDPNISIGKSRHIAMRRFLSLERRLENDSNLKKQYHDVIQEYFDLNQLEPVTSKEIDCVKFDSLNGQPSQTCSYLPHHAVVKSSRLTTKCRVVYDASTKTSNGRSLNDALCIGPKILNDLPAVLTNWRSYKYVYTADIQKMYRCIDVDRDDAQYQRILWRFNPNEEIKDYFLNTVTFGTSAAPFLAIRTTHQLADDEIANFPLAEHVIKKETYVDDVCSGGDTIETAIANRNQTRDCLKSGGFELRKFASNSSELLKDIPIEHQHIDPTVSWNEDNDVKTLGMHWNSSEDYFFYKIQLDNTSSTFTKRSVASQIAKLYDPLGLINPIIEHISNFGKIGIPNG